MKTISPDISQKEFIELFELFNKFNESYIAVAIDKLFNRLREQITFEAGMRNASIHLVKGNLTFSACGFRRSKDYFFVEFYNETSINNKRIVREVKRDNVNQGVYQGKKIKYIISRVEIRSENEIDDELIKWIFNSYKLIDKTENAST